MNEPFCEPWSFQNGTIYIAGGDPLTNVSDAHVRRVVACVNACAGLSTEELEKIDGRMVRVLQPRPEQVSPNPQQGGNPEQAQSGMGASGGELPRSVPPLAALLGAFVGDLEDAVERVLMKHGIVPVDVPPNLLERLDGLGDNDEARRAGEASKGLAGEEGRQESWPQMSAELIAVCEDLLDWVKEDRECFLESASVPVFIGEDPPVFADPDPETLDEEDKDVLADYDGMIARAEAAIAKAKAGAS